MANDADAWDAEEDLLWLKGLVARAQAEGAVTAAAFLEENRDRLIALRRASRSSKPPAAPSPFLYTLR